MRTHIWIRKENEDAWAQVQDKSEWVNSRLSGVIIREEIKKNPTVKVQHTPKGNNTFKTLVDKFDYREECAGHQMRWDCGLKNCKKGV